jgi:hypothetical protein
VNTRQGHFARDMKGEDVARFPKRLLDDTNMSAWVRAQMPFFSFFRLPRRGWFDDWGVF